MRIKIIFFFLILLINYTNQELPYTKIVHNIDPMAKCLDGSPAAIYQFTGSQTKKFIIFFMGGASCGQLTLSQTIQSCYNRSKTPLGSSKLLPNQLRPVGFLSTNQTESKFANWTKFIIPYCDGSFHQGFKKVSFPYKDSQLYFRGALNTRANLQYIKSKFDFFNAQKVIVSGVSAGAIATFSWTNYIQAMIKDPFVVLTLPDSSIFLNTQSFKTGLKKSQIMLQSIFKLANSDQMTPFQKCNSAYVEEEWKCLFFEYSFKMVYGKMFVINSQYDSYNIEYQMEIECLTRGSSGMTLSNCTEAQLNAIQKYRKQYLNLLQKYVQYSNQNNIWSISCSNHVYLSNYFYNSENQMVESLTLKTALQSVVFNNQYVISIDKASWPANKRCAY